ncbi:MAG TPA: hypothetical protein PKU97_22015, partial [Kofleriaceae bacterium]|nr:hypothetical protein [Kofleriaceae bacterium]
LGAAAVATAAAAFALGRSGAASAPDPCTGGEAELVAVWSPQRVATIQHHLETMGGYGREQAPGVLRDLGQAARGWTESYQQACSAHQRAELTSELYQRRLGCLVRTKVALGTAIEVLGQTRRDGLDNALLAARSLPDATLCAQEDATQLAPPPAAIAARLPLVIASIERARILAVAVHPDAAAVAAAAARDAAHLGYAPVAARAQLVLGRVEAGLARWDPAEVALGKALEGAVEAGDDRGAVEAFARLLWVASRRDRPVDGASIIELVARRTGPAGAFGRALLYNNLATRQLARADRAGARRYLEAAQAEIAAQRGPVDLELVSVAQNLVLVAERAQERERLASAVVEATARALGEHHVKTLVARVLEANETADLGLARQRFAATCDSYQRHHPHLATAVANCFYRLAWLADEAGDLAAATEAMRRAISDPSPERLQAKVAELYVAARSATAGAAALQVQQALQGFLDEHADDKEFWKRLVAVDAAITFAQALTALGDARGAQRQWQRALTIAASLDPPLVQRRLARIRGALAD